MPTASQRFPSEKIEGMRPPVKKFKVNLEDYLTESGKKSVERHPKKNETKPEEI